MWRSGIVDRRAGSMILIPGKFTSFCFIFIIIIIINLSGGTDKKGILTRFDVTLLLNY